MNIVSAVFIFVMFGLTGCQQFHYLPAQILIPTFNVSGNSLYNTPFNNSWSGQKLNSSGLSNSNLNAGNNTSANRTTGYFNNQSHNGDLIVGNISYMDHLLFNQVYFKPRRWWSSRDKTIEYPKDLPGGYGRHETISSVRVYNKFYDGLHSTAKIEAGGVGHRYVKIKLSSSWGSGFKYAVQIYGH